MTEKQRLLIHYRMLLAQARQALRDLGEGMSEAERDILLDQIAKLLLIIRELEK